MILVLLTQVGGNAYWLYRYRGANYQTVSRQLQSIVPPGASVYGIETFRMALIDRVYYAYDRTPLDFAVEKLHPQYMILYDRVMMNGSGHGEDNFADLHGHKPPRLCEITAYWPAGSPTSFTAIWRFIAFLIEFLLDRACEGLRPECNRTMRA
jgi:hypothetical protein